MAPAHDDKPHVPGPSLWPAGFAVGIVVLLVGLIISWWIVGIGALVALAFAFLWVRDLTVGTPLTTMPDVPPERPTGPPIPANVGEAGAPLPSPEERYPRAKFLEISTLGVGGIIGGLVGAPAIGFAVAPAFLKQGVSDVDVGPVSEFPEGKFVITTFTSNQEQGTVSRRTAFIRYNGDANGQPSFTVISNHCAHLGCPVQANGPLDQSAASEYHDVSLVPTVSIAGFGCPCHGGQYDTEGNRIAGPPVRSLDRYSFAVKNGHLFLGKPFSVAEVVGAGATAQIHKVRYTFPGEHVTGLESWLYPVQPPH